MQIMWQTRIAMKLETASKSAYLTSIHRQHCNEICGVRMEILAVQVHHRSSETGPHCTGRNPTCL